MGRLRVLVLDECHADGPFDPGCPVSPGDIEVVGTLRIAPRSVPIDLIAGADGPLAGAGGQSVLREAALGLQNTHAVSTTEGARGASAGEGGSADRDPSVYLTRTELDVLRLLAKGLRNKDIARELYISVNTVKTHVASIFRKLRVKNRSQAVMYVYSRGRR
ncbi:MAG: response regulator transcription factor [Firmicutes bacterium]|jgi:DNA-binding NarL/FixJ family response regulator|nr:response regulator transcription factor [Bacillota bacterium]MDH7496060.1 response regulator transcription factor [Bacillota bacterium]